MADQLLTGTTLVEKESRSIGDVPIGGIVSWAKTLSGVPNLAEGWVECDGAVLVDALSPLNGQTIPDLNGDNRFLRGNSTSGGTGGSETHSHVSAVAIEGSEVEVTDDWGTTAQSGVGVSSIIRDSSTTGDYMFSKTKTTSTLPTYYGVVWIMRVR